MRVMIEAVSGPAVGKKIVMGTPQVLRIGRTEWADHSFPGDGRMSGVHFSLENDGIACYVNDLGSSNGTYVNGQRINDRTLIQEGDEVRAGQTIFTVHVEGAAPSDFESPAAPAAAAMPRSVKPPPQGSHAPGEPAIAYSIEKCDSGLVLCRGEIDEIAPADLAVLLAQSHAVYLIVDFKHLGIPVPSELAGPAYLFDWLSAPAASAISPVVITQEDLPSWPDLIREGWGKDGVICLFSMQERDAVLSHLRRACHAKSHTANAGDGILGYCWPSILSNLLSYGTPKMVDRLLTGIEMALVEFPDLPETWQLFGRANTGQLLDQFGFRQAPLERAF